MGISGIHLRWEKSIGGYFLLFLIFFWGVSLTFRFTKSSLIYITVHYGWYFGIPSFVHSQSLDSKSSCYLVPSLSYLLHSFTIRIYTVPPFGRHYIYSHACSQQILFTPSLRSVVAQLFRFAHNFAYLYLPFVIPFGHNSLSFGLKSSLTFLPSVGFSRIFDTPSGSFVRKPYSLLKLTIIILVYLVVKERSD